MAHKTTYNPEPGTLSYVVGPDTNFRFSLSPEESDFSANQNLLDHLVATLVKYGPSGRPEPFLADSWEAKERNHFWTFSIRAGLSCQDGTAITATSYADQLQRQLKRLSQKSAVMDFDLLQGWQDFVSGKAKNISGISVEGRKIFFRFKHQPDNFLETLRKVYFGFWCEFNFSNGQWKDPTQIVSSGAYQLESFYGNGSEVVLTRRPGWFSLAEDSPKRLHFISGNFEKILNPNKIMALGLVPLAQPPEGFQNVQSAPTWLVSLVLHAKPGSVFNIKQNRVLFLSRLRKYFTENVWRSSQMRYTESFFPLGPKAADVAASTVLGNPPQKLKFVYSRALPPADAAEMENAIRQVLPEVQEIEFSVADRNRPNWLKSYLNAEDFDVRIQSVDVGGTPSNSGVKMMFCTTLGVSYPDSSKQICHLVKKYDSEDKALDDEYSITLNRILAEQAEVIPLFHTGLFYLYSDRIDPKSITPQLIVPRLDLLKMR